MCGLQCISVDSACIELAGGRRVFNVIMCLVIVVPCASPSFLFSEVDLFVFAPGSQ